MTSDSSDDSKKEEIPLRRRRRTPRRRVAAQIQDSQMDAAAPEEAVIQEIPPVMPLLPLRDVVVFNYMIVPLFVGRDRSVQAVEAAATQGRHIFLCAQKDGQVEDPTVNDLYPVGTVALILRILKTPDGRVKALVQGVSRGRLVRLQDSGSHVSAQVEPLSEPETKAPEAEQEALIRFAREQCERILSLRGIPTGEIMSVLGNVNEPGRLSDLIAANLRLKMEEAQEILQCLDPMERLRLILTHLMHEAEVATMQIKIQTSAREGMDKAQKDYFLREQLKAIRKELGDVLLHIIFYAKIGSETGDFDIADVCTSLTDKLIFRHPHVFGEAKAADASEVAENWEQIKLKEKDGNKTVLGGVPAALPALIKANRIQEKARNVGFDWEEREQVWDKVREETAEVEAEIRKGDKDGLEAEFGDLLFALVNACRLYGVDPESALERTNKKFIRRFNCMEEQAAAQGHALHELTPERMEELWQEAKKRE